MTGLFEKQDCHNDRSKLTSSLAKALAMPSNKPMLKAVVEDVRCCVGAKAWFPTARRRMTASTDFIIEAIGLQEQ